MFSVSTNHSYLSAVFLSLLPSSLLKFYLKNFQKLVFSLDFVTILHAPFSGC